MNPYLQMIGAALATSSSGVFIKLLELPPHVIAFFRLALPTILLGLYITPQTWFRGKRNYKPMMIASIINALRLYIYFWGFGYTSVANASIMLNTIPTFSTILGIAYLKEKVSAKHYGLLLLSFIGVVIVYSTKGLSFSDRDVIGMSAILFSSFLWAIAMMVIKKELPKFSQPETLFYQNIVGAIVFLPFFVSYMPYLDTIHFGGAVLYAFIVAILGFGLMFSSLRHLPLSTGTLLGSIEVVFSIAWAIIFLHETITAPIISGGLCIGIASYALTKRNKNNITSRILLEE